MKRLILITLLYFMTSVPAWASDRAGMELAIGGFGLNVYFGDASEYVDGADSRIREPGNVLFSLLALLQENSAGFSKINHTVQADLYVQRGSSTTFLAIVEDPDSTSTVLYDHALGSSEISSIVSEVVCARYGLGCTLAVGRAVTIYMSHEPGSCVGRIRFGAFPSMDLNDRYCLLETGTVRVGAVTVGRSEISRYFEPLDP